MKTSTIAVVLVAWTTLASLAQDLPIEDRVCIANAVTKLPPVAGITVEGSRVVERRVVEQPQSQGRRIPNPVPVYRLKVEIDVSVAGQRLTHIFNCIQSGQATLIQPLGMR